jgi:hypothetical protein
MRFAALSEWGFCAFFCTRQKTSSGASRHLLLNQEKGQTALNPTAL